MKNGAAKSPLIASEFLEKCGRGEKKNKTISQMFSVADQLCFGIIMYQLDEL